MTSPTTKLEIEFWIAWNSDGEWNWSTESAADAVNEVCGDHIRTLKVVMSIPVPSGPTVIIDVPETDNQPIVTLET
jgi:hypothetical protein